jgi:5-hydroxyisourate hydrolase-like protein (transthyretin family)
VPLFAADGLHEYKLRFGYEMAPHYSAIQLHPVLDVMLNQPAARAAVRVARRLRHNNQQLETLETVLEGARSSGRP